MDKLQQIEQILVNNSIDDCHDFNLLYEHSPVLQQVIDDSFNRINDLTDDANNQQEWADNLRERFDDIIELIGKVINKIDI